MEESKFNNVSGEMKYPVMSFEELASVEHEVPYFIKLEKGNKKLFYFGARHSRDPEDPMFQIIEQKFMEAQPDIVFVEGNSIINKNPEKTRQKFKELVREDIIQYGGEPMFTVKLAIDNMVPVISPEPDDGDEIESIHTQGFSEESIFAYYMYRIVDQYHRTSKVVSLEEYILPYIQEFENATRWKDFDYSLQHLRQIGEQFWGVDGNFEKKDSWRTVPTPYNNAPFWTTVNQVSQQSSYIRDQYIVASIEKALSEYNKVFVVFGASHAVMQERALKEIFDRLSD